MVFDILKQGLSLLMLLKLWGTSPEHLHTDSVQVMLARAGAAPSGQAVARGFGHDAEPSACSATDMP